MRRRADANRPPRALPALTASRRNFLQSSPLKKTGRKLKEVEHVHARPLRDLFIGSFFELPGAGPEEEKSLIHPPWERYVNN